MAIQFTPEDGTGIAGANAYIDQAKAAQYAENTGRLDKWSGASSDLQQTALIRAAGYIDELYGHRYNGALPEDTADTQGLLWPRVSVPNPRDCNSFLEPEPVFPDAIGESTVELAFEIIAGRDLYVGSSTGTPRVTEKSVRVEGAVSKAEKFGGGGVNPSRRTFPAARALLKPWIKRSLGLRTFRA